MTEIIYRVEGTFSASHQMPGHSRCNALHGHNYKVEVFVKKRLSTTEGVQVDLTGLKHALRDILKTYDHTHLNDKISYPSCENIALSLIEELKAENIVPSSVRVWETPLQWVEVVPR